MNKSSRPILVTFVLLILAVTCEQGMSKKIPLVVKGQARHRIVVPPESASIASERFAAEELQHFLGKITGTAFTIVDEAGYEGPGIYLGATRKAKALGIDVSQLGDEEWILRTAGADLILTGGRPRGTLYAVYEFLSSQAGCRWVSPDIGVLPSNPEFSIPALDIRGKPGFSWRETTLYNRHDDPDRISKEDYALFLVRNRYNSGKFWLEEPRFGFAVGFGRPAQSHTFYLYQKEWEDVKPEYFAMTEEGVRAPRMKGPVGYDFCLSNEELRERFFKQLLVYIKEDREESAETGIPAPTLYAISQNDTSSRFCHCPACTAIAEREGSFSGTMIDFANAIAERAAKVYPDVKILTEAYQFTKRAPKTIRPRENVVIRLPLLDREYRADEIADVLRPITGVTNEAAREVTEGWTDILPGSQLFVWDYAQFRASFRYPYDATRKILKNLNYWHDLGIERVFIEQAGIDISFRPMRDWLFFRKSVDPDLDDDFLVGEFINAYFGPAAGPMRNYYDLLANATEAGDKPYFETQLGSIPYLSPDFFTQTNAWLDEAETRAQGEGNAKFLRHVQLERVPVDSAMAHLWSRFADSPAWKGKKEEVLVRYEKNKRMLIRTWATTVNSWVSTGAGAIDGELASLRLEAPAKFAGQNANLQLMGYNTAAADLVEDEAAAGGRARRLGKGRPEDCKLPFQIKVHNASTEKSWQALTLKEVPADEAYHWYLVGEGPLDGTCRLWSNVSTWIPLGWGAEPPPSNEREIWVSMKFTGPMYVEGSTQADQVLIDQVVLVAPAIP
ncbi:MAG: hypothetical protein ACI8UO_005555 [Verrucomicrobiales bacterium]|jgi:hypothetical protein